MLRAPNLVEFRWLKHGFGGRASVYPDGIATVKQIHSTIVAEPGDPEIQADALITRERGRFIGVRTADCVPILIADAETRAVAAVHAGWRGTAGEIVRKTVDALITRFGVMPQNLHAAIGPAIGPCCYEVSPELARQFGVETRMLDLKAINAGQLRDSGVNDVWVSDACTKCEAGSYFSFRREKENPGRQVAFIGTNEKE